MKQKETIRSLWTPTAGMLTGARRAAMLLLTTLLLTLTAQTAWAEDVTLQDDNGTKYINMPQTDTNTLTLTDANVTSFKVYDDGGKTGTYSNNCNGTLVLTAPSGYVLQLSGSVHSQPNTDYLTVYDGSDDTGTKLLDKVSSTSYDVSTLIAAVIPTVVSSGQNMTLNFYSNWKEYYHGLDLTVTLINTNTESNISVNNPTTGDSRVTSNKSRAKVNETITLTATPAAGYMLSGLVVTTGESPAVVTWTQYENSATFRMPAGDVTVTPTFTAIPAITVVNPQTGGTITPSAASAIPGTVITLTAEPTDGYVLSNLSVTDGSNNDVAVTDMLWYTGQTTATFTMPASDVTVTPTFTNTLTADGGLYVNMPAKDSKSLTIPSGIQSFKVYDDGGSTGRYSDKYSGTLVLTAPSGSKLYLSGNITSEKDCDKLTVYDGSDNTANILLDGVSSSSNGVETAVETVTSMGNTMTLCFSSDTNKNYAGLDLTVTVYNSTNYNVSVVSASNGSVSASINDVAVTSAKVNETITLTATPAAGYILSGLVVTTGESPVAVTWTQYENSATFRMPAGDVTVTPTFTAIPAITVVNPQTGGTITPSAVSAIPGTVITLTTEPTDGYVLSNLSVTDGSNNDVVVTDMLWYTGQTTATFTMPASDVRVTPTFTNTLTADGGLYVNMPAKYSKSLAIPSGIQSFKVYDDGGSTGNYSNRSDGTFVLTAPAGYVLRLSGSICTDTYATLFAYDNSAASGPELLQVSSASDGTATAITTVTSTGRSMTLYFRSASTNNYAGLDLTVTLVAHTEQIIAVSYIDENSASQTCAEATVLTGSENYIGESDAERWYTVQGNLNYSNRLYLYGNCHLILEDGATMATNGIVYDGSSTSLIIYGQSESNDMGSLTVTTSNVSAVETEGGNLTINGGCTSFTSTEKDGVNTIPDEGTPGTFTINGGNVTCIGGADQKGVNTGGTDGKEHYVKNGGTVEIIDNMPEGGIKVSYLDADGQTKNAYAVALTGSENYIGESDAERWYTVQGNLNYSNRLYLYGNCHLILEDGATMATNGIVYYGSSTSLTIFGQSESDDMGSLTVTTSDVNAVQTLGGNLTINGGCTSFTSTEKDGVNTIPDEGTPGTFTINGGNVTCIGGADQKGVNTGGTDGKEHYVKNGGTVEIIDNMPEGGIKVSYLDADGQTKNVYAVALTGSEIYIGEYGAERWYIAKGKVTFDNTIYPIGDCRLILEDEAEMTVDGNLTFEGEPISNSALSASGPLTIYGQSNGTGTLNAITGSGAAIYVPNHALTICGGVVNVEANTAFNGKSLIIYGGEFTTKAEEGTTNNTSISATNVQINDGKVNIGGAIQSAGNAAQDIQIYGGQVSVSGSISSGADIILGWTSATDFIKASSYNVDTSKDHYVKIADGKVLKYTDTDDESTVKLLHTYIVPASVINGKELTPYGIFGYCGQDNSETTDVDESKNVTWSIPVDDPATEDIDESKTITISGTGYMMFYNSIQNAADSWSNGAPWKAFADKIEAVVIEKGITYVGSNTFAHCPNIKSVTLPTEGIYEIGPGAFGDCTSLTSIDIPMSVNNIGDGAFAGCSNLATVSIGYGDPCTFTLGSDVFPVTTTILVPESAYENYIKEKAVKESVEIDNPFYGYKDKIVPATRTFFATSTNTWMTWCDVNAWTLPEGCTAYTVSSVSGTTVTLSNALTTIPAYTPVLIQRDANVTAPVTAAFSAVGTAPASGYDSATGIASTTDTGWAFYGTTTDLATIPEANYSAGLTYVLYGDKFLKSDNNSGIAANRCWLKLEAGGGTSGARLLSIVIDDNPTAIDNVQCSMVNGQSDSWYTINGRKLNRKPTKKGLYIYNGKKVAIK